MMWEICASAGGMRCDCIIAARHFQGCNFFKASSKVIQCWNSWHVYMSALRLGSNSFLEMHIRGCVKSGAVLSVVRAEGTMLAKGYFPSEIFLSPLRYPHSQVLSSTCQAATHYLVKLWRTTGALFLPHPENRTRAACRIRQIVLSKDGRHLLCTVLMLKAQRLIGLSSENAEGLWDCWLLY